MPTNEELMESRDFSFRPVENAGPRHLTPAQITHFNEQGYLKPFRVHDDAQTAANRAYFDDMLRQVEAAGDGRNQYSINGYHTQCAGVWDMLMNPRVLDYVEDLLGPNFVCWGTHFFCKMPHDPLAVPWHQDASYWPFDTARTVTAWLAIDDADVENACMHVIPGTHRLGKLEWKMAEGEVVLHQQIVGIENYGAPVPFELKAGEISLHADMLAHGSGPNESNRRRCGLTIRYCPVEVRALQPWNHDSVWCRGSDPAGHWANVPRPEGEKPDPKSWQRRVTAVAAG